MSKLFDRLKNAARLRGGASADHSLLALALQRAALERAQSRAAGEPPASDSAPDSKQAEESAIADENWAKTLASNSPPVPVQAEESAIADEDWAKTLAANDDVDSKIVAAMRKPADRDERAAPRRRMTRGIVGILALVAIVTLVVISLRTAQAPPAPVPVFQLDKTLR